MYFDDHNPPHFHAEYGDHELVVGINPIRVMAGDAPHRVRSLVFEWAAMHQQELHEDWGDYWIIDLSDDYSYAVVGHPGRDYLWILACTPTITEATYQSLVTRLQAQGYETSRLVRTLQVVGPPHAGDSRSPERS